VHAVKHAIRFGADLSALVGTDAEELERLAELLAPDLREHLAADLQIVSADTFAQLAPQAPRTGLMAIAMRPRVDLQALLRDPAPRPIVLLEDPRNLANMGACVRVAAAADVAGLLTLGTQDPWQPDALRAAAGLHYALPVARLDEASFGDRPLVAVDPEGDAFVPERMPSRAVLAFGSERYGISDRLWCRAVESVSIPMRAGVSSLNLATAVAAILFAWRLAGRPSGSPAAMFP
jgi:TrmH family RNA methyltransferase